MAAACPASSLRPAGLNSVRLLDSSRLLAAAFLGLSALDLLLTWSLLNTSGECFYEANPVAAFILETWGWWGMGLFKLACAATVVGASALLGRRCPRAGRRVLALACPVLAGVVGYSLWLSCGSDRSELATLHQESAELEVKFRERREYSAKLAQFAHAVAARQLALPEAARSLGVYIASLRFDPWHALRTLYPDLSDEAVLAAALVREVGHLIREGREKSVRPLPRLIAEFISAYAIPLPEDVIECHPPEMPVGEAAEDTPGRRPTA